MGAIANRAGVSLGAIQHQFGEKDALLDAVLEDAKAGRAPDRQAPAAADLNANERIAIDFADAAELTKKARSAAKGLRADNAAVWKALRPQGSTLHPFRPRTTAK